MEPIIISEHQEPLKKPFKEQEAGTKPSPNSNNTCVLQLLIVPVQ